MIVLISLLKNKFRCFDILRLSYTAHILQFAIIKRLALTEILIAHVKRLIGFFII